MRSQLAPSNTTSYPAEDITYGYDVLGTALLPETYIRVSWGWLTLIAVQLLMAVVVLALTIVETNRLQTKVLKNSPIATLVVLEDEARARMGGNDVVKYRQLEKRATKVTVRLANDMLTLVEKSG